MLNLCHLFMIKYGKFRPRINDAIDKLFSIIISELLFFIQESTIISLLDNFVFWFETVQPGAAHQLVDRVLMLLMLWHLLIMIRTTHAPLPEQLMYYTLIYTTNNIRWLWLKSNEEYWMEYGCYDIPGWPYGLPIDILF